MKSTSFIMEPQINSSIASAREESRVALQTANAEQNGSTPRPVVTLAHVVLLTSLPLAEPLLEAHSIWSATCGG